jgi:hypothetical protein
MREAEQDGPSGGPVCRSLGACRPSGAGPREKANGWSQCSGVCGPCSAREWRTPTQKDLQLVDATRSRKELGWVKGAKQDVKAGFKNMCDAAMGVEGFG